MMDVDTRRVLDERPSHLISCMFFNIDRSKYMQMIPDENEDTEMFREDGSLYMRGRVLGRESLGEKSSPLSWQSHKLKTFSRKQTSSEKDDWVMSSCIDHVFLLSGF